MYTAIVVHSPPSLDWHTVLFYFNPPQNQHDAEDSRQQRRQPGDQECYPSQGCEVPTEGANPLLRRPQVLFYLASWLVPVDEALVDYPVAPYCRLCFCGRRFLSFRSAVYLLDSRARHSILS
jgi:hypothetical protein